MKINIQTTRKRRILVLGVIASSVSSVVSGSFTDYFKASAADENENKDNAVNLTVDESDNLDNETPIGTYHYGADVSFPMMHATVSKNYDWLPHNVDPVNNPVPQMFDETAVQPLGDRQNFYDTFMQGCRDFYGRKGGRCDSTEADRVRMTGQQPANMQNYTEMGFKKIKCPEEVWKLIKTFWDDNKHKGKTEQWGIGNTYTNNWEAPTEMVSVEDRGLRGGGSKIKDMIWASAKSTIEEWTQQELTPCSLYGIRVYKEGAVLAPHVDRLPLVSSAIINVAQDTDEPWPIEVISHDGRAYNVTMEPGEMVLYESHSVIHGRPFPLKGRFYANLFVHFEPVGHSLRHNHEVEHGDVHEKYKDSVKNGLGGHENQNDGLPSYIKKDSPEEDKWRNAHPGGWKKPKSTTFETGSTEAHQAATRGDIVTLTKIAKKRPKELHKKDVNGWQPIHEGARGGHHDIVKLLVEHGGNVNEGTDGNSGTPLYWAEKSHGKNHPVIKYLKQMGALSIGPEL